MAFAPLKWHRPLTVVSALFLLLALVSAVGIAVDGRTLLGDPVWLKPAKFGFAFGVYGLTLAWLLSRLKKARRTGWWFGTVFAVAGLSDITMIVLAAARGTFSHFNASTDAFSKAVQIVFAYGVPPIALANIAFAILVLVQRSGDRAVDRALRAGLLLSTLGMIVVIVPNFVPGLIEVTTRTVTDAAGREVTMAGGHGLAGHPDGNGMALTGWNDAGGDIRVPHFVGLHGVHVLLLIALVLAKRGRMTEATRRRVVGAAALGYAGFFLVTSWQMLRDQSFAHPDAATLTAYGVVAIVVAAGLAYARVRATSSREAPVPVA
ncbi:hypothetical protein Afil01_63940 [Actinorhabdospora filicis]|uniref:Uncharacterized protein n=1 Tax=Actinorhabdospora filicis TaxID=1785913 RepID=A0A9W6STK2_9ACTN|nr:hypothetical protein [Actinorhabdospora filicis]GLZ81587.1 hypothetical protein Afil01_63940 [Actinorhabdospora filicis]